MSPIPELSSLENAYPGGSLGSSLQARAQQKHLESFRKNLHMGWEADPRPPFQWKTGSMAHWLFSKPPGENFRTSDLKRVTRS